MQQKNGSEGAPWLLKLYTPPLSVVHCASFQSAHRMLLEHPPRGVSPHDSRDNCLLWTRAFRIQVACELEVNKLYRKPTPFFLHVIPAISRYSPGTFWNSKFCSRSPNVSGRDGCWAVAGLFCLDALGVLDSDLASAAKGPKHKRW